MANDKANWQNVNVETLPSDLREAYTAYKAAYAEMKGARDRFENGLRGTFSGHTPKGKRLAVAYNFGKLSIAMVDDDAKPKASTKAVDLSDLIRR